MSKNKKILIGVVLSIVIIFIILLSLFFISDKGNDDSASSGDALLEKGNNDKENTFSDNDEPSGVKDANVINPSGVIIDDIEGNA